MQTRCRGDRDGAFESGRNVAWFGSALVPKAQQSLEAARSGYATGRSTFMDVIDAQRRLLEFELSAIEARTQGELAIASISLVISGSAPDGAPGLPISTPDRAEPKEARP